MIFEVLQRGAQNAIPGKELCSLLHLQGRELTEAVEKERREGHPICASTRKPHGYFLAEYKDEMEGFCNSMFHRAGEIHKTRKACLKTIPTLPERSPDDAERESYQQ